MRNNTCGFSLFLSFFHHFQMSFCSFTLAPRIGRETKLLIINILYSQNDTLLDANYVQTFARNKSHFLVIWLHDILLNNVILHRKGCKRKQHTIRKTIRQETMDMFAKIHLAFFLLFAV